MKLAILDLGTNTFHLLIASSQPQGFEISYRTQHPVKLGQDITRANQIIPEAFERAINCLIQFKNKIDEWGVEKIKAIATSAVRSATNGAEFVAKVKEITGITLEVIDGDKEAQYIFEGVKSSGALSEKSLIMDIGGGSTEFILCDDKQVYWKRSFDIGAARLMQKFFHSDPLHHSDLKRIERHLANHLIELKQQLETYKPTCLIGSAGAFETYAEMLDENFNLSMPYALIDLQGYRALAQQLIAATHAEREKMDKLIPLRVDMIVMATVQTNYVLALGHFHRMKVSTYDLKMGVLESLSQ